MLKIWNPHTCYSVCVLVCYTPPSACSNNDTTVWHTRSGLFSSRISDGVQSFSYKIKYVFRTVKQGRNMKLKSTSGTRWVFLHFSLALSICHTHKKGKRFPKFCTLPLPPQKSQFPRGLVHNHSWNEWNLYVNEISYFYERMDAKTRFEKEA